MLRRENIWTLVGQTLAANGRWQRSESEFASDGQTPVIEVKVVVVVQGRKVDHGEKREAKEWEWMGDTVGKSPNGLRLHMEPKEYLVPNALIPGTTTRTSLAE